METYHVADIDNLSWVLCFLATAWPEFGFPLNNTWTYWHVIIKLQQIHFTAFFSCLVYKNLCTFLQCIHYNHLLHGWQWLCAHIHMCMHVHNMCLCVWDCFHLHHILGEQNELIGTMIIIIYFQFITHCNTLPWLTLEPCSGWNY